MSQLRGAQFERLSSLDRALDQQPTSSTLAPELFAVVDLLDAEVTLRRSLADPSRAGERRAELARRLLGEQISASALAVVTAAVEQRWTGPNSMVAALERQAVRAEFLAAQAEGAIDQVEDELFRFTRLVSATPDLRDALGQQRAEVAGRQKLVTDLLDGKAHEATVVLARRAVRARTRSFVDTAENYLSIAAQLRDRVVATVRVARELSQEQSDRLRIALTRQVGREVDLQVVVDPDLIGGVRIELGDEVIEGTVAGRLKQASRTLS